MEGIGIFHDEFPPSHQSEARPYLIPEFGLDLIEIDRELPVGAQQISRKACDHLFMGRTEAEFTALAVLKVEHDPLPCGVSLPPPASLPQLGRMQLREKGFEGAGAIHLLSHDAGDALDHLPHHREVGVDPGTNAPDVSGAKKQLMGGDLGFRRHIAQRHQHLAGDAHGRRRIEDARSYHR